MLPARLPKRPKRESRWRSPAHLTFVRGFACASPLCGGQEGCHAHQHRVGEVTFWNQYKRAHGQTVEQLIDELCAASPKRREIADIRKERERV